MRFSASGDLEYPGNRRPQLRSQALIDVGEEATIVFLHGPAGSLQRLRCGRRPLRQVAVDLARLKRPTRFDLLAVFSNHLWAAPIAVWAGGAGITGRVQDKAGRRILAEVVAANFRSENRQSHAVRDTTPRPKVAGELGCCRRIDIHGEAPAPR